MCWTRSAGTGSNASRVDVTCDAGQHDIQRIQDLNATIPRGGTKTISIKVEPVDPEAMLKKRIKDLQTSPGTAMKRLSEMIADVKVIKVIIF